MAQSIFLVLSVVTVLAGAFAYFSPPIREINPLKLMMDGSGYSAIQTQNQKKIDQIDMVSNSGVVRIRKEMDILSEEQNRLSDMIQNQQQILKDIGNENSNLLLNAQQKGGLGTKDLLQLEALASEMQDKQRLLVAHGQDLIALNNRLTQQRQWIADLMDKGNNHGNLSGPMLSQHYAMLKDQANKFFDKVNQHDQEIHDFMDKFQDHLPVLADKAVPVGAIRQQNQNMLDREQEQMVKLADSEQKSKDYLRHAQEKEADFNEILNDKLEQNKELIEDEHQKDQDQQDANRQHLADQLQHSADQTQRIGEQGSGDQLQRIADQMERIREQQSR